MPKRWRNGSAWSSVSRSCTRSRSWTRWKKRSGSLRGLQPVFSPDPPSSSGSVLENKYYRLSVLACLKALVLGNVPSDIARILGPGEQVELFIQQKIYHPKINIDSVVLTSQRIILRHPHELGLKKDFTDFNYTDVANAILDKGMLRSTVKITLRFGGDPLNLNDLPNSDAEKAYGIIRSNISRFQTPFSTGYAGMAPVMPTAAMVQQQPPQMQGIVCNRCGARSAAGMRFCGSCGKPF
jgi:hypothetical protein